MIEPKFFAVSIDETRYNLNGVWRGVPSTASLVPAASTGEAPSC